MSSYAYIHSSKAGIGNKVSHAKNRSKRSFRHNLHTVTIMVEGVKQRLKLPARMIKMLKKTGLTTHFRKAVAA
ncbi:50S ribosomal protein L28 [Candidatus Woesebacteria bacterium]|nr:50S ribosomal protein L28 [Candidatus Woesebacteria bacterium]